MATIFDMFTAKALAANWTEVQSNKIPYLGTGLFPADKKLGLDLSWIKGSKGLPVSLMPTAFDAKATFRDRPGVSRTETEMPFFREGYKIKEKDRQEILRMQDAADPYAEIVLNRVFNDARDLLDGAAVVPERMRMALLFAPSGEMGITFNANGVSYVYEYDANDAWKAHHYTANTDTAVWSATSTADPFAQFDTIMQYIQGETGSDIRYLIMNSTTFNLLPKIDAVKNRFLTTIGQSVGYITKADIVRVFRDVLGVEIVIYDKQYKNESGTAAKFVPDDYVALIPEGPLGTTWYGTTPEEADLLANGKSDCAIVDTGVALLRTIDEHPVNVNLFASEIVLPSFERMDECALLKVK